MNMPRLHPLLEKLGRFVWKTEYRIHNTVHSGQVRRGIYKTRRPVADIGVRRDSGVPRVDLLYVVEE